MLATRSPGRTQSEDMPDHNIPRFDIAYSETNVYDEAITKTIETQKTNSLPSRLVTGLLEEAVSYFASLRTLFNFRGSSAETQSLPRVSLLTPRPDENFNIVLGRLADLLRPADDQDISPEPSAFESAWDLLSSAREYLKSSLPFPKAGVGIDNSGTIFVAWRNGRRKVHLAVPSQPGRLNYIYHEEGDRYAVEYDVTGRTLAKWLEWYSRA